MFTSEIQLDDKAPPFSLAEPSGTLSLRIMLRIVKGARLRRHPSIPDIFWKLITRCWSQNPMKRPHFSEIVEHMRTGAYVIDGTDMERYREYQERILRASSAAGGDDAGWEAGSGWRQRNNRRGARERKLPLRGSPRGLQGSNGVQAKAAQEIRLQQDHSTHRLSACHAGGQ
jgi:hypothetical protein